MNQGKLEVVKQEMARVNIDILGIGEKEMQKGKVVEDALQIAEKRRAAKCKKEKKKIYPCECRVPKKKGEISKSSSVINAKK